MHHIHHHQHWHPAARSLHARHMEHPSKRRRVEQSSAEESHDSTSTGKVEQEETHISAEGQDWVRIRLPKLVLPSSVDKALGMFGPARADHEPPLEPPDSSRLPELKLELRQVLAPVASVAGGVVNDVQNAASGITQPPAAGAATPGSGQLPAAIAAQDARNSALAAEQAQAVSDTNLPAPPAPTPQVNPTANPTPAAEPNPTPMQLQASGSNAQEVLSTPPTPLPASPAASANPSAPSSYFTSSPATLAPPANSASRSNGGPVLASNNSTASSTSMTGSVTSSATNTISSSSLDAAALAALSASRASQSLSVGLSSFNTSGPLSGSITSQTTMMTMTSSFGTGQSLPYGTSAANTGAGVGGVGGASNTAGAPTSTSTSGLGAGGGSNNTPATPALIGGIVGGISGLVLILLTALLLLRWKKGRLGSGERRTISPPMLQTSGAGGAPQSGTGTTGTMTERSSTAPIATAGIFGRFRPSSSQTATTSDTAPSERGFQKISGRKLPSVLTSGGDGYGDGGASRAGASAGTGAASASTTSQGAPPKPQPQKGVAPGQGPFAGLAPTLRPSPSHSLSGSSFYRDSKGFYGGVVPEDTSGSGATEPSGSPTSSSPTFPSPLAVAGGAKDPGNPSRKPTMRPGPARTAVMHEAGTVHPPRPARGTPPPSGSPNPRDLLGRSHPSEDGSRASRFRESTTPP